MTTPALHIPDAVTIEVRPGTTVLITSDLHFAVVRTDASAWAEVEVARVLEDATGPAVYIMAGDVFELWAGTEPTAESAMASHPRFEAAVKEFASQPDRHVLCLPRNHDGSLGWDAAAARVPESMGARMAFAVDLVLPGPNGPERVHVEHGHLHTAVHGARRRRRGFPERDGRNRAVLCRASAEQGAGDARRRRIG